MTTCKLDDPVSSSQYGAVESAVGSAFDRRSIDQVTKDSWECNELPMIAFEIGETTEIITPASARLQN
ncbi:hypothetical protein H2200_006362 [Cladophialophora chaetospira]|uniref:Uncharacterized protein n=1 Tax=Cladophialophora chaetospira TaxID=386627 RepID=A0AA39CJB0_9EURO|nr:hypothetical protein H2200_006362 [Cladophialophora chaetospira]